MLDNPFWQYWYFHLPNYVLAALIYTLTGRVILGFMVLPDSRNYIWRFFRRLTDPVLAATAFITPRYIPFFFMPLVGVFWLALLRHALFVALFSAGLAPQVAAP